MLLEMGRRLTPQDEAQERLRRAQRDVERQIAEAAARGELRDLEGEGRPFGRDPDEGAGERWAAAHVLRNANATPEWIELRRSIFSERDVLVRRLRAHRAWLEARRTALRDVAAERLLEFARATDEADRRRRDELEIGLRQLNARIARHNLLVRAPAVQLFPLTMQRMHELADRPAR